MTTDWQHLPLGSVVTIDRTQGVHVNLPYVGLEDIEPHTGRHLGSLDPKPVKSTTFKFDRRHVLYGRLRAYLNKWMLPEFEGHCSTEIFPLLPASAVSREWLAFWLATKADVIDATSHGARMPRARMEEVLQFEFPVPPLDEQQRIVTKLDELLVLHSRHSELLGEVSELESSLRTELVDALLEEIEAAGSQVSLHEVADVAYGYTESATSEPVGPKFLRITDIQGGTVDWSTVPYCRISPKDLERHQLREGDLVFARTGATTGKSFLVTGNVEAVAASYLIRVRPIEGVAFPGFLAAFFSSSVYWDAVEGGSTGSAQGGFNASKLNQLRVPWPDTFDRQVLLAEKVAAFDLQYQALKRVRVDLSHCVDRFRSSLLAAAFNGEL